MIAKWESRSGKHWAELHRDAYGYSYKGNDCGGNFGMLASDEAAIQKMQERVDSGYFLPDSAKTPMRRTA